MRKLIIASLSLLPFSGWAGANPNLTEYFRAQLNALNGSVVESESSYSVVPNAVEEMWYMNQFSLRLRAPVGFDIDGFASFQVVPETEMIWQRANPDGWTNFRPAK